MKMNQVIDSLRPLAERLSNLEMENHPLVYQEWLSQTYHFVCHSVPLLRLASHTGIDPLFKKRCADHIVEEGGHELVALSDLKELGIKASELNEWKWTRKFYQRQYQLTQMRGELLLGYILALEGLAILAEPMIEPLNKAYGPRAIKFAKIHVEEDQEHLAHAIGQTMQLDIADEIIANFETVIEEYGELLDGLESIKETAAAA